MLHDKSSTRRRRTVSSKTGGGGGSSRSSKSDTAREHGRQTSRRPVWLTEPDSFDDSKSDERSRGNNLNSDSSTNQSGYLYADADADADADSRVSRQSSRPPSGSLTHSSRSWRSTASSSPRISKARRRFERLLTVLKTSGAPYSALAIVQHSLALLKRNPSLASSFGKLDISLLQSTIANFRNFLDLRGVFNYWDRAKTHHQAHRYLSKASSASDGYTHAARALAGCQILGALVWAGLDSVAWLTSLSVIRHSTDAAEQAAYSRKFHYTGYKFKFVSHVMTYARLVTEELADRQKRVHAKNDRSLSSRQARAVAEELKLRRRARIKAALVNTLWLTIAAAHLMYRRQWSPKVVSTCTILVHGNNLRDLWKTVMRAQ